jgi:two-component system, NtrC family, sensor histidine kinase HydH
VKNKDQNFTIPKLSNASNFNLLRWFAVLSPVAIGLIALGNALLISSFLNDHLFQREASISRDFVQNILLSDDSLDYFTNPGQPKAQARFANSIVHLANMQDVLRTNVYSAERVVLWSTDSNLINKKFGNNDELDEALRGELVVHAGNISSAHSKEEHAGLSNKARFFVESYIPIVDPVSGTVVGAVELYKAPIALTRAIEEGQRQVVLAAVISALLLYVCLYWLVRRADRIIKEQRNKLMEAETMSVVGELTSAVAHNIRNPLSSIRSSAEMIYAFPQDDSSIHATEIMREVDRISARITELLRLSGKSAQNVERIDLRALLNDCLAEHSRAFSSRKQSLILIAEHSECYVEADRALLLQVFISLLSNASEAMPHGGTCTVRLLEASSPNWQVEICDEGVGIDADTVAQAFRPFFTTKPKGLGLGLPLAKRIVERFGGSLTLRSMPEHGTVVYLVFPKG